MIPERSRRYGAALAACALLAAACQPSRVDSSARVTVSGRLARQGGDPAQVEEVVLAPSTGGFGDLLGGTFLTLLSFGLVCLADSPPEPCEIFRRSADTAKPGADGSYSIELKGSQTRSFFGNARPMSLSARLPEGAVVMAIFKVQTEQLQLPDLRFWEPQVRAKRGGLEWDAIPASGYGKGKGYEVLFEDRSGRQVWSAGSTGTGVQYDARVLEDTQGTTSVVARREEVAPGTTMDLAFRSAPAGYEPGPGPAPSRSKPCSLDGAELRPCPVTDGDVFTAATLPAAASVSPGAPAPQRSLTIDLGTSRPVPLVVLRGCSCKVALSVDGSSYVDLGEGSGNWTVALPRSRSGRYIRLTGSLDGVREVSVW